MGCFSGPRLVSSNLQVHVDVSSAKSFRGLPTTNLSQQTSDYTGSNYGSDAQWSDPTQLTRSYNPNIITPIGSGATLIAESGGAGYHYLSRYGGGGESFSHSISCYVKPLVLVTEFWIGMLGWTGKGVSFNLANKTVNSESVTNNNYFIHEVSGFPGWLRIGANIEGRAGGWVGALGYSMLSYTGTAGAKAMYITGIQYEYTPYPTSPVAAQTTRGSTLATGGGISNLVNSIYNSDAIGSDLRSTIDFNGGIVFNGTDGQSFNFGTVNYGSSGSKEATINYWLRSATTGAWNTFGAGGPGYYYAFDPYNQLVAMIIAKNASDIGVNDWPTTAPIDASIFTSPCMVTAVMKEDAYFKWYVNGSLVSTRTPPFFSYLRFYDGNFRVGQGYATTGVQFNGTIYSASAYSRELTASEIKQNFNAMRRKFNI